MDAVGVQNHEGHVFFCLSQLHGLLVPDLYAQIELDASFTNEPPEKQWTRGAAFPLSDNASSQGRNVSFCR